MWTQAEPAKVNDGVLRCPECGESYLHQGNTTIYERAEDAGWTTVIAQNGNDVVKTDFPSADVLNPSRRRHGLIIEFTCEHCHYEYDSVSGEVSPEQQAPFRLAIYQHKGFTFVEWTK